MISGEWQKRFDYCTLFIQKLIDYVIGYEILYKNLILIWELAYWWIYLIAEGFYSKHLYSIWRTKINAVFEKIVDKQKNRLKNNLNIQFYFNLI